MDEPSSKTSSPYETMDWEEFFSGGEQFGDDGITDYYAMRDEMMVDTVSSSWKINYDYVITDSSRQPCRYTLAATLHPNYP